MMIEYNVISYHTEIYLLQNQTQTGTALQVFYNLGLLKDRVDKILTKYSSILQETVLDTLDPKKLTSSKGNFLDILLNSYLSGKTDWD